MIDIHSHILPGLDDGAGSLEEAPRHGQVRFTWYFQKNHEKALIASPSRPEA